VTPSPSSSEVAPSGSVAPSLSVGPSVTPPTTPTYRTTYAVRSGDTLAGIAAKFKTTATAIKKLNGLTNNTIHIGQKLKIP